MASDSEPEGKSGYIVKRVGVHTGNKGKAARQYIKKIEIQCWWSNLEDQRCFVFLNTLENDDIEEYFWYLSEQTERNNWDEWKAKFLSMQSPEEYRENTEFNNKEEQAFQQRLQEQIFTQD